MSKYTNAEAEMLLEATLVALALQSLGGSAKDNDVPTFSRDVAPILYKRCVTCHSEGRSAPFSLVGYAKASRRAKVIAAVTTERFMPPWKADVRYSELKDVPVLTDDEIALLKRWADAGAPEGDRSAAPREPVASTGWTLGEPDLVLSPDKATAIPAEGGDFYRDYVIDPHISKPTWVRAVDFRPSGKDTVHHVIPFIISKEDAEKQRKVKFDHEDESWEPDSVDIERSGNLGFWSTGAPPFIAPDDTAFLLKPGQCILLDMHYKSTGKLESEKTQVGLYLSKEPPKHEMKLLEVGSDSIYLQPGLSDQRFYAIGDKMKSTTTLYAVWPHMHYLGRTFKAWVKYPSGFSKPLVLIKDWDANWQLLYYLKEPLVLPKGSKVYLTGTYDNSKSNPRSPGSGTRVVESGPSSKDEMLLMTLYVVQDTPKAGK
ncbi:MAG: cytochrome c [Armatimonadetes bacterium]|nr:cytochrome c [Armatimonadota bacterium]